MEKREILLDNADVKSPKCFFMAEKLKSDCNCECISAFHCHNWYEFFSLSEGSCTCVIEKNEYVINPGDWMFIPGDAEHKVYSDAESFKGMLFRFSGDYISFSLLGKLKLFNMKPLFVPNETERSAMKSIALKMMNAYKNSDECSDEVYKAYIFELMLFYVRSSSFAKNAQTKNSITDRIIEYVMNNYSKNINLDTLAIMNDVSANYISKKFKKDTGINIIDYINMVKIDNAKKLLIITDDSINDISKKCGFGSSDYFSYVFKKQEKVSPNKYRKEYLSFLKQGRNV